MRDKEKKRESKKKKTSSSVDGGIGRDKTKPGKSKRSNRGGSGEALSVGAVGRN